MPDTDREENSQITRWILIFILFIVASMGMTVFIFKAQNPDLDGLMKTNIEKEIKVNGDWWQKIEKCELGKTTLEEIEAVIEFKEKLEFESYVITVFDSINEQRITRKFLDFIPLGMSHRSSETRGIRLIFKDGILVYSPMKGALNEEVKTALDRFNESRKN